MTNFNGNKLSTNSKLFDCLDQHNLSIAKLHAYDVSNGSFRFLKIYLSEKEQCVKINSSFKRLKLIVVCVQVQI